MNFELEKNWRETVKKIAGNFGEQMDLQSILFVIGLQELKIELGKLSKDQKIETIHVGICTILAPYGYYEPLGVYNDGWPHFKELKKIPNVNEKQQEEILKQAVIDYFESN